MTEQAVRLLVGGMREMELESSPRQIDLLVRYADELLMWNRRMNLVGARDEAELVRKHLLDSLAGYPTVRDAGSGDIADIGSGAGLPGIPLAVMLPERAVYLVERSGKRCAFLRSCASLLRLPRLQVVEADYLDIRERFGTLTFRAFAPLTADAARRMVRILEPGGTIVAYKGKRERASEELVSALHGFRSAELLPVEVPGVDEERTLLLLRNPA